MLQSILEVTRKQLVAVHDEANICHFRVTKEIAIAPWQHIAIASFTQKQSLHKYF